MFCQISLLVFVSPLILELAKCAHDSSVASHTFCYDNSECGAATWSGLCKTGRNQSPINIQINDHSNFYHTRFQLNKNYGTEDMHHFYAQNNGHTVQFELNPNTSALTSNLAISGGRLPGEYKFAQLHFHWSQNDSDGSEHTLNGEIFPMEVHLVHYKSIYESLSDALTSTNDPSAVAVFGVFFQIATENNHLNNFIDVLPSLRQPGEVKEFHLPLHILYLLPDNFVFARYMGSLTTPTCDEKVVWTVFLTPLSISEEQMNRFRVISNDEGTSTFNFRPTQPLNGRKLGFYFGEM